MTEIKERAAAPNSASLQILGRLSLFITLVSVLCFRVGCLCTPPQDEQSVSESDTEKDPPVSADTPASAGSSGTGQVPVRVFTNKFGGSVAD
jgi:hypothetical protein